MNPRELRPSVSIILWHGNFYVSPQFFDESGLVVNGEPIAVVPQSAPSTDLGAAILVAMDRFGPSASSPFESAAGKKRKKEPILSATKASSFSALWKDALFTISVEETPSTLHFYPSRKAARGQYLFKRDKVLVPKTAAPDLIGDAARQAFEKSD